MAPPAAAATAAASSAATSVEEWPPSFKDFVSKCFATCTTADNKALLTLHLRTLTQQSKSNKTLHSTDWSLQPVMNAVELEAAERAKNAASVKVPPPAATAEPKSWLQAAKKGVSLKWGPEMGAAAPAIPPPPPSSDIAARLQFKPSKKDREGSELDAPLTKVSKKQQKADAAKGKKYVGAGDELGGKAHKRAYDATNALLDDIAAGFITEVVKGTCEQLEKPYMRQQMQPLCSEVRPERVLIRSIALMKDRHAKGAQYDYISEQMKSIRQVPRLPSPYIYRPICDFMHQDLQLQAIRNATTADACEFLSLVWAIPPCAPLAVTRGIRFAWNTTTCRSLTKFSHFCGTRPFRLRHSPGSLAGRDLYKEGVGGQPELLGSLQLLYWVYYSNWTEVSKLLQLLLPYKDHPDMQHALKVISRLSALSHAV